VNAKKERREVATALQALPLLAGVPGKDIEALADAGRLLRLHAGWTIMAADTPADSAYVVVDGTTCVRKGEVVLAHLGAGAVIGESALIEGRLRTATVSAETDVTMLRIGYDELRPLLASRPALQQAIQGEYDRKHLPVA
jgi:CRP/FNR family transcriptional regulator, cyclic AMP receptor protein